MFLNSDYRFRKWKAYLGYLKAEIPVRVLYEDLYGHLKSKYRAGKNVLCPFHNDKVPSMSISPDGMVFYCHACEESGDIFYILYKEMGYKFNKAVEYLVAHYNVKSYQEWKKDVSDYMIDWYLYLSTINKDKRKKGKSNKLEEYTKRKYNHEDVIKELIKYRENKPIRKRNRIVKEKEEKVMEPVMVTEGNYNNICYENAMSYYIYDDNDIEMIGGLGYEKINEDDHNDTCYYVSGIFDNEKDNEEMNHQMNYQYERIYDNDKESNGIVMDLSFYELRKKYFEKHPDEYELIERFINVTHESLITKHAYKMNWLIDKYGITENEIYRYKIGYFDASEILDKFTLAELEKLGVTTETNYKHDLNNDISPKFHVISKYITFNNRFTIPLIYDDMVYGLMGRKYDPYNKSKDAKIIFARNHSLLDINMLFGLDCVNDKDKCIPNLYVVEGWGDALALQSKGLYAVAINGTKISNEAVKMLAYAIKDKDFNVVVLLDNDEAGNKNSLKVRDKLKEYGIDNVYSVTNYANKEIDPADLLKEMDWDMFDNQMSNYIHGLDSGLFTNENRVNLVPDTKEEPNNDISLSKNEIKLNKNDIEITVKVPNIGILMDVLDRLSK